MKRIAYILECFPSLTERFILRELEELHRQRINIRIFALRGAPLPDGETSPEYLRDITVYCPRILSRKILAAQLSFLLRSTGCYLKTFGFIIGKNISKPRDLFSALKHFPYAVFFAEQMKIMEIEHIHAHFANLPTTLALITAKLLLLDFSFSAHAWDIYAHRTMLYEKIQSAKFVITCNNFNQYYLTRNTDDRFLHKINRVYHGLDINKYSKTNPSLAAKSRSEEILQKKEKLPFILSVGRLEAKKGFFYLLEAYLLLKAKNIDFSCLIAGEGSHEQALKTKIERSGLSGAVKLLGPLSEESIMELYLRSDIFVLPCITTRNGDHDGLPNVLIEASALEVPVISTNIGGIPELIEHEKTGILVPEKDADSLASALESLIKNKDQREQLARNARTRVVERFNIRNNIVPIIDLFHQE